MKVNHPKFQNMQDNQVATKEQVVHTVAPPDEHDFMTQMSKIVEKLPPEQNHQPLPPPINDELIANQLKRKAIFDKLVLLKQPHCKKIVIDGMTFKFKLLNAHENAKVYAAMRNLSDDDKISKSSIVMLSGAIVDIDGEKIEDLYAGPELPEGDDAVIAKKYYEMCTWPMPLISSLVNAYQVFIDEVESGYTSSFLDKSQKTQFTD